MPDDWKGIGRVDIYRITMEGPEPVEKGKAVIDGGLRLSLQKEEAISIVPHAS
jgi:hypothetical protein